MEMLETLRDLTSPELVGRASSILGESESGVSRGLGAAGCALLGSLASKSGNSEIMRQIMALVTSNSLDIAPVQRSGSLLDGSGLARSPVNDLGSRFLATLLGGQTGSVTNALASYAGIKNSSASTLLGLAAPLVMSVLSDRVRRDGLTPSSLSSLLGAQRADIIRDLPSGLTNALGLGTHREPDRPAYVRERAPERRSWPWLGPALAGLAALGALWLLTRPRDVRVATAPAPTPRLAVALAEPEAGSFTRRLPNKYELSAAASGIERKIVSYIEDPKSNVDTATWFDFDRLLFETGSATLKPESRAQLRNVAEILKAYPAIEVKIGGYTDNVGDPGFNLKLSQERAANVTTELASLGVSSDRLSAEGYGERNPIADNSTEEGRHQNRRIALRVTSR